MFGLHRQLLRHVARGLRAAEAASNVRGNVCTSMSEARASRLMHTDALVAAQEARTYTMASRALGFAAAAGFGAAAAFTPTTTLAAPSDSKSPRGGKSSASAAGGIPTVVFVLGGPGAGKGTQCTNIVNEHGFVHLSAGDLLRAHMKSGSPDGNMVAEMIKQGQIVPSEVTVNLLLKAMQESGKTKFLIDGFPRNKENRDAWEHTAGYDCEFVLFFDCPEDVMEKRLLGRNEGRTDDNIETIRKRFKTFKESSMPVIGYYEKLGKVRTVNSDQSPAAVYAQTTGYFNVFTK